MEQAIESLFSSSLREILYNWIASLRKLDLELEDTLVWTENIGASSNTEGKEKCFPCATEATGITREPEAAAESTRETASALELAGCCF